MNESEREIVTGVFLNIFYFGILIQYPSLDRYTVSMTSAFGNMVQ